LITVMLGLISQPLHPSALFMLVVFATLAPLAMDMFLPGVPAIGRDLRVSPGAATATVSAFIAGLAAGQLFAGPLSDRIGRRPTILGGLALFMAGSILAALVDSMPLLLLGRLIQALGASAVTVAGRAIVGDLFSHRDSARVFSTLSLVTTATAIFAPSLGSALLVLGTWRLTFLFMAAASGAMLALSFCRLDESRSAETEKKARGTHPLVIYLRLLQDRRLLGYLLAAAFNSACFFTYLGSAPLMIMNVYGMKPSQFGLIFAVNAAGLAGASQLNRWLLRRHSPDVLLLGSAPTAALLAIAFFTFALTLWGGLPTLLLLVFFVVAGTISVQANTMAGALSVNPNIAGSIAALFGATAFGAGTIASIAAGLLFDGTARGPAVVIGC
jgi:MFS transporter, DHA1 family, multidrug resistance protein